MTEKRDVLEALLMHEINLGTEIVDVLGKLKYIELPEHTIFSDSHAWCWLDNPSTKAEKKKVLTAFGYDVERI